MPSPVTPNEIKEVIPSPTGNFCEKFLKALTLPKLIYSIVLYMFKEDGKIASGFASDVCALDCFGGSDVDGDGSTDVFGRPTNVSASDGTFTDKVEVLWTPVADAIGYDVYRSEVNEPSASTLIGSSAGADTEYDDLSAGVGESYYYWVRARSSNDTSGYSNSDTGYRSDELVAITNLAASPGAYDHKNPQIVLEFSPIEGADSYDIYRSATNDFATAVKIDTDRVPYDNTDRSTCQVRPQFDTRPIVAKNLDHIAYIHTVEATDWYVKLYFWVVGKVTVNAQVVSLSPESNSAEGWAIGFGDNLEPTQGGLSMESNGTAHTITAGMNSIWLSFWGGGGAGAGGDGNDGGGGGGAGGHAVGKLTGFTAGVSKLRVRSTPESDTGITTASTNGLAAPTTQLEYSPDGTFTDTILLFTSVPAGGGLYVNGGLGAGGAAGSVAAHASLTDVVISAGRAGGPARTGGKGGRGGASPWKLAACTGLTIAFTGGGANSVPTAPSLATGGQGLRGACLIQERI